MSNVTRIALSAAVGFALGLAAGSACNRPGVAALPPVVEPVYARIGDRHLKPIFARSGDAASGPGVPAGDDVVWVYLDVSGTVLSVAFR